MRTRSPIPLAFTCLIFFLFSEAFPVASTLELDILEAPEIFSNSWSSRAKRQPATISTQQTVNNAGGPVPVVGQQTQNITSTADTGTSSNPQPGLVTNPSDTSNEVDCKNITTGRDNKCWAELGLSNWVNEWVADNACHTDEPFASCFLRTEGFPGLDCTGIKPSACTSPQGDNLLKEPEVFYVAYNIYGDLPKIQDPEYQ